LEHRILGDPLLEEASRRQTDPRLVSGHAPVDPPPPPPAPQAAGKTIGGGTERSLPRPGVSPEREPGPWQAATPLVESEARAAVPSPAEVEPPPVPVAPPPGRRKLGLSLVAAACVIVPVALVMVLTSTGPSSDPPHASAVATAPVTPVPSATPISPTSGAAPDRSASPSVPSILLPPSAIPPTSATTRPGPRPPSSKSGSTSDVAPGGEVPFFPPHR
jgi:hypothetical protein